MTAVPCAAVAVIRATVEIARAEDRSPAETADDVARDLTAEGWTVAVTEPPGPEHQ